MKQKSVAVVGAAETTDLGVIPNLSQIQMHADAALNTLADAGLKPTDIDGIATAGESPANVARVQRGAMTQERGQRAGARVRAKRHRCRIARLR
jgi:hypothetical protein